MSKFEKSMEEIFDIVPSSIETKPVVATEKKSSSGDAKLDDDLSDDYRAVRHNYEEIITKGKDAIDEILKCDGCLNTWCTDWSMELNALPFSSEVVKWFKYKIKNATGRS